LAAGSRFGPMLNSALGEVTYSKTERNCGQCGDSAHEVEKRHIRAVSSVHRACTRPLLPIRMLTQQNATFSRESLLKLLNTHTVDAEQFTACVSAVMASPELVELDNGRYTSREMVAIERRLVDAADDLAVMPTLAAVVRNSGFNGVSWSPHSPSEPSAGSS
jgi:hypothetical protein